ncbi:MAG TPA: AarF/UbiB family protein [Candidatus Saccharimonadia bacterium]|nr:AarF/UbiB family protein [Candidatus Saccharimonadia bacterium]
MESETHRQIKNRKSYIIRMLLKSAYFKLKGDDSAMMTAIADSFLDLGGVYVKFLQGVLLQLPMMKLWQSSRRFDVYEDVPADLIDVALVLQKKLKPDQLAKIKSVSKTAFASGSFGQVYRGTLYSNEDVIIKILRPDIQKLLKKDLRLINLISRLLTSVFTNWNVDSKTLVKSFVKSTLSEVDYLSEARFADEMYRYYLRSTEIVIPKTYLELSNKSIIIQDYVGGISLAQLLKENAAKEINYAETVRTKTGSNLKYQLTLLGVELNKAILNSGPIHGDPHPGNIRLLSNNRVALLDFGIHARPLKSPNAYFAVLREFWKAEYLNDPNPGNMFVAYIRFYSGRLYDSMRIVSDYASKRHNKTIRLDDWIINLSNKIFEKKVSPEMLLNGLDRIRAGKGAKDISVDNIINPGNRFQISVRINDGAILRMMATYLSLVTELGYRFIIPEMYNEVVKYVREFLPDLEVEQKPSLRLEEAMEIVYSWLEKVARNDSDLYSLMSKHLQGYS